MDLPTHFTVEDELRSMGSEHLSELFCTSRIGSHSCSDTPLYFSLLASHLWFLYGFSCLEMD